MFYDEVKILEQKELAPGIWQIGIGSARGGTPGKTRTNL